MKKKNFSEKKLNEKIWYKYGLHQYLRKAKLAYPSI